MALAEGPPMLYAEAPRRPGGAPTVKALSSEWFSAQGIGRQDDMGLAESPEEMAGLLSAEPWVASIIDDICIDTAGVPLIVYIRSESSASSEEPAGDSIDNRAKAIQFLLDDVNDEMTGSDLTAWHMMSELTWGEDYWAKIRGPIGGAAQQLRWLRPPNVTPNLTGPKITSYTYRSLRPGDPEREYRATEVVPFRTPNPRDATHGIPPLLAAKYDIAVDRLAAQQTAYTLANYGVPPLVWVAPKDSSIGTSDMSSIRRALRALRGPRNAGKSPVLPGGLEPKPIALTPKDAEWLAARKQARMTIAARLGMPLVLAGDDDKNTVYGNLRDAERIYWRRLVGRLDRWGVTLSTWLLPDFGTDARAKYRIGYDYSKIEALRPTLPEEMNSWDGLIDRSVATPNEARRHFRIGADKPWGNDPLRSAKIIQEPPEELPAGAPQVEIGAVSVIPTTGAPAAVAPLASIGGVGGKSLREITGLYSMPAVKAWLADQRLPIDMVAGALGVAPSDALRVGLQRRYTPAQLADGYPAEGFPGLEVRP